MNEDAKDLYVSLDLIAEKESFLNLLNSIIACAVSTSSPLLSELQRIRNAAYYDAQFSWKENEDIIMRIHEKISCNHQGSREENVHRSCVQKI